MRIAAVDCQGVGCHLSQGRVRWKSLAIQDKARLLLAMLVNLWYFA
jgi:hypothetical protein